MTDRGQTEFESMDSPLVEFEDEALPDGSVVSRGPEVVFLGKGGQVRWGNVLARLGARVDPDGLVRRAPHGDRFFVATATTEYVGDRAELADTEALRLIDQPDPEADGGASHAIPWAAITRVGIVPAF